jgi:phospholipid transport system substrate-binding protein
MTETAGQMAVHHPGSLNARHSGWSSRQTGSRQNVKPDCVIRHGEVRCDGRECAFAHSTVESEHGELNAPYVRQRTANSAWTVIIGTLTYCVRGRDMRATVVKCAMSVALALVAPAAYALEALALAAPAAEAPPVRPDVLLKSVSQEVIGAIKQDRGIQAGDHKKIAALVEARILPLFDFGRMTQIAMARNWRLASPEQQTALIEEFKILLVRTYSAALSDYRNEVIEFRKLRASPDDTEVTVKSDVKQPGKEWMTLDYVMEMTPEGWKIYDVKVAGVRLVMAYREIFAEKVRDVGVDGLIKSLADGNRQGVSRFNSVKNAFWEKSRVMYVILRNMLGSGR